jgi:peptidase S41-like protein
MLRFLYQGLLRLHPPAFRKRFAEEIESIFDRVPETSARVRLSADAILSLLRQWSLRPEFWREFASGGEHAASDGIPSFYTLEPFRPRTAAVVHGLILTVAVFCLTCFAIRYSWTHVLHVRIPKAQFESSSSVLPGAAAARLHERKVASRPAGPTQDDFSGSSRSSQASQTQAPGPAPVRAAEQKAGGISQPAPSGRAGNRARRAASAFNTAQNAASQPGGAPESSSRQIASAGSGQAGTPVQPAASAPPLLPNTKIEAAERHRVIEVAVADLTRYYVDPDAAQKMAAALRAHENSGDDDAATEGEAFADLVTQQMQDVSHDKHVMMIYGAAIAPESLQPPSAADIAAYRKEMERTNCRFEIVRVLPRNVGYLKLNSFPDAEICGPRAAEAMAKLNDVDAIIFDLRDNPGGYANMVALIATYLFDRPTHLNDFYNRGENTTEESWTLAPVAGNKLADKPAFVLTSQMTFSAAEAFSYDLKMLKRATLVGETTSGRGHMAMGRRIDDHFMIRVPDIKVVNPISKTNWDGTGVEPDVKVKAADALATADKLAESKLQRK